MRYTGRQLQAGQSHSRTAVWSTASISTGHSTGGATYGRCSSETGRSTSGDRGSILNDRSGACRLAGTDPRQTVIPDPFAPLVRRYG